MLDNDVRKSTKKVYKSRMDTFSAYCRDLEVDPTSCPVSVVVNFLSILRRVFGYEYQTICSYRSAISKYHVGLSSGSMGTTKVVKRLTRACFIEKPPLPRYSDIWDMNVLVRHLESMDDLEISVLDLGMKTLALLAILSISRYFMKRFFMTISTKKYIWWLLYHD